MNGFANFLPTLMILVVVVFTAGIVQQLVLNALGVQNISNPGTQKFATAALKSFVTTAMFAVGLALIGNPYTLMSFFMIWGFLGIIEYIMPSRR